MYMYVMYIDVACCLLLEGVFVNVLHRLLRRR